MMIMKLFFSEQVDLENHDTYKNKSIHVSFWPEIWKKWFVKRPDGKRDGW